jgi:hypothetical protein
MSHFPTHPDLRFLTRRQFFSRCALGLGSIALASMMKEQELFGASAGPALNPMAIKPPHFPAKAKNIIYLFMAGGPSQLELFDHKPKLQELNGQPIPDSFIEGKRFASWAAATARNCWARAARSSNTADPACGSRKCFRTPRPSWTT